MELWTNYPAIVIGIWAFVSLALIFAVIAFLLMVWTDESSVELAIARRRRLLMEGMYPDIEERRRNLKILLRVGALIIVFTMVAVIAILAFNITAQDFPYYTVFSMSVTLTILLWSVAYPDINGLQEAQRNARMMRIIMEDYFRKDKLAQYVLAAEGKHRQKLITMTHQHLAERSPAEFLAEWRPLEIKESPRLAERVADIIKG